MMSDERFRITSSVQLILREPLMYPPYFIAVHAIVVQTAVQTSEDYQTQSPSSSDRMNKSLYNIPRQSLQYLFESVSLLAQSLVDRPINIVIPQGRVWKLCWRVVSLNNPTIVNTSV